MGLGVALATVITPGARAVEKSVPEGVVAQVNGRRISSSRFEQALTRLVGDAQTETSPSPALKQRVLEKLVDEELLVQRGIELNLHRSTPAIRQALLAAVLSVEAQGTEFQMPTDQELELFYDEVKSDFKRPAALHLRQVLIVSRGPRDAARARAVAERAASMLRAGMSLDHVCRVSQCETLDPHVPQALTPLPELEATLGPELIAAAHGLAPGAVTDVINIGNTYRVLQVEESQPATIPPLAEVQELVVQRFRFSQRRASLAEALSLLREHADITTTTAPPKP